MRQFYQAWLQGVRETPCWLPLFCCFFCSGYQGLHLTHYVGKYTAICIFLPSRQNSLESASILGWGVELKQCWWMVVKWNSKQPRFWDEFSTLPQLDSTSLSYLFTTQIQAIIDPIYLKFYLGWFNIVHFKIYTDSTGLCVQFLFHLNITTNYWAVALQQNANWATNHIAYSWQWKLIVVVECVHLNTL